MCGQALRACIRRDPTALLYFVFRGTDPAALANVGTACLGDRDFVDRDVLDRDVMDELIRRLPLTPPRIGTAPATRTLVRLPTVFWATNPTSDRPDPPRYQVHATIDDVALTLTATGSWTWDLHDGQPPRTLTSPGVPYRPGRSPDPRRDAAYYTDHDGVSGTGLITSYADRGHPLVRLTTTWTPSYTVDYQIGTHNLDRAAVTYTTSRTLTVGEARAVLVSH